MNTINKETKQNLKTKFHDFKQGNFSSEDTATVLNNVDEILMKSKSGPLREFFDDIKTMCSMVKSWAKYEYKEIPIRTIGMVILTLGYVFFPIDLIPDTIPILGLMDDAMLVNWCLAAIRSDIHEYRLWAQGNGK